ncbi:MAG: hypothetical protein WC657_01405 [Candidatus Paceibacterota bacterium]|jgi:hypothetical protein
MFKKILSIGRNFKGLTMCKKCLTFYYKNSWHLERPKYLDQNDEVEVPVHFTECLACMEQDQAQYETESNLVLQ